VGSSKIPGGGGEVKLDFKGMGELLRSQAIADELESRMVRVQAAVPGSDLVVSRKGRRVRVKVVNGSDFDETNTGNLSRALDLAGGERGRRVKKAGG
jgi:hypothetical protein